MKYKIVAFFDDNSTDYLRNINCNLRKKFRLNRYDYNFHIEMISTPNADLNVLNKVLLNILTPYKNFKVKIDDNLHINPHSRKISLKVLNKGYLSKITRNISDTLLLYGFKIDKQSEDCDFYVTISDFDRRNLNYINKSNTNVNIIKNTLKVNKIKLLAFNSNREFILKSYTLREY